MAATPAATVLDAMGLGYTWHTYRHDPRSTTFGLEAVAALGVEPDRFFKTLVVALDGMLQIDSVGRGLPSFGCGVVPVSGKLDLRAFAKAAGGKRATMANPAAAERITGYVRGGISPIGQKSSLACVVDETAILWPTVFVSAGQRGASLELAPDDLVRAAAASYAAIAETAG